jgi:hypothetical protein
MFNNIGAYKFLQVIRVALHRIQEWSILLPEDEREPMVARDFFNQAGWQYSRRLTDA